MKKTLPLVAIAVGIAISSTANAQESAQVEQAQQPRAVEYKVEHPYVGVRAGWATFNDACDSHASACNDDTLGLGIYAGYQFNQWFGLEAGYTDFGTPDAEYGSERVEADVRMIDLSGVARHQLNQEWSVYGRLGASYEMIDKRATWMEDRSANEWGVMAAAGVEYALSPEWSVRTELQYNDGIGNGDVEQADLFFTSVGVVYHFKDALPAAQPAPAPQPAPIPAPAPMPMQKLNLNAGALFANASAVLHPTPELHDAAAAIIKAGGPVVIVGHTDSRGSDAYNQRLSEQRANAVADYFLRQGIHPSRLQQIEGRGESQPIADNATEAGRAQNRRVEITFSGEMSK